MTRTRPKLDQPKPKWLGGLRNCTKTNPITQTRQTYEGFQFNNITAYVGDYVLVFNVDADEPDTMDGCDVARIEHLFESPRHHNDKFRADVQWFSKPSKLPTGIDTDHMDPKYEIVEDYRKFDRNVSIETIHNKCLVINAYEDEIPEEVYLKNKSGSTFTFVCRYRIYHRRSEFHVEPVLKLDGMLSKDEIDSCSGIANMERYALQFVPNSIVYEETKRKKKSRRSTPKVQNISSPNQSKSRIDKKLRTALRKCSIDSDSEASQAVSVPNAVHQDSDFKNTPKSTPKKNPPSRSSNRNESPLKSNRINTPRFDSNVRSVEKDQSPSISKNSKINAMQSDVIKDTPTKTKMNRFTHKRRATRSSSEESLEPRSRSVSPEIDCIGPPAAYKLYETKGHTFVIKKPICIDQQVSKKLNDADISGLLSSDESDNEELFDKLKKSGTKIVARSKSDESGFELLSTPNKSVRLLESIKEYEQADTPKTAKRNLSETLELEESRDARKDLLLKKLADKREDASLRIKLRRSSEQSSYKIDSDSDNGKNNKSRRRNVPGTPKSIMKADSNRPTTPSVQFNNQDEMNEYSPDGNLSKKLLKVEIKLKRVETEEVRKSQRTKKANTKYSDFYESVDASISPGKRLRKTVNYRDDTDNERGLVPNEKIATRQTRRSMNIVKYDVNSDLEEAVGNELECSQSEDDYREVRKSPRTKKASTKYSDYYEIVDAPISPSKHVRKTVNYRDDTDNEHGPVPNEKIVTRQTRRSMKIVEVNSGLEEAVGNELECSQSKDDESNGKNCSTRTSKRATNSRNATLQESSELSNNRLKTPVKLSEMKRRDSSRLTNNDLEGFDLTKTPRSSRRIINTNNLTTPGTRSTKIEFEQIEPATPKRNTVTPKKIAVTPKNRTPMRAVKNGLLTPSMKQRNLCIATPSTPLQDARARLHVSAVPKSLPCREVEFNNIYTFLEGKLMDNSGGCLYISGVPGTGKTATVNEVIRCLKKSVSKNKLNDFEFLEINGMKLTEPRQAYVEILKQLTGKKATWEQAHQLLEKRFTNAAPRRGMTLLLVDELDILCNKRQDVVYTLLDWPAKSCARLVVITIANTMDLPERVLMGRVTSRLGLTRLTFQPYTHQQLQEIVTARLNDSHAFKSDAIQLVARKVAAVSGDARRALDICRRATEVAEVNDSEIVSMQDVNEALTEMIASPKIQAIRHCSEMERTFLLAVCAEVARTGVEEVTFNNIYMQLTSLCSLEGLKVPSVTEALTICAKLGAYRLLICEHSRTDIHQRVLLNISSDDVHFSMQNIQI